PRSPAERPLYHSSTLFRSEHAAGLWGEWKIDDDLDAQRAAKKAHEGSLNFMSVRFAPIRSEWTLVDDYNPDLGAASKDKVLRKRSEEHTSELQSRENLVCR